MFNKHFYKELDFWMGTILLGDIIVLTKLSHLFTLTFWKTGYNIENIIFLIVGIILIIRALWGSHKPSAS